MRDALSQLQIAYARQSSSAPPGEPAAQQAEPEKDGSAAQDPNAAPAAEEEPRPGPAQSSGRLWVPGS
jgi:hypothetical protein